MPPQQIHPTWPRPFAQQQNIVFNNSGPTAQPCTAPRTLAEFTLRKKKKPYWDASSSFLLFNLPFFFSLSSSPSASPCGRLPLVLSVPARLVKKKSLLFILSQSLLSTLLHLSPSCHLSPSFIPPPLPIYFHPSHFAPQFVSSVSSPSLLLPFFLQYRPLGASLLPSLRSPALLICSRAGLQSMGGAICERLGTGVGWGGGEDDSPGLAWRLSQDKHTAD